MEIALDFSSLIQQAEGNPFLLIWVMFKAGGWVIFLLFFNYACILIYLAFIRSQYRRKREYIVLAIDVPRDNEQTPRAVENIFHHLAGAHQTFDFITKWWHGEIHDSFSFEIISLEGYIQFLVHCVDKYRDLIEAAIYAQYPDAEIIEVEDYTKDWNLRVPHEDYDIFGTEIKLPKKQYYPIKTHPAFEDPITQEVKDPMAGTLESLSRLGPGEQIWLQLVCTPADNDWGNGAKPLIAKLIGAKPKEKMTIFDLIFEIPKFLINFFSTAANPAQNFVKKDEEPNKYLYLTVGEKDIVTAIEKKIGKLGFHVKFRYVYIAKKEVFDKYKANRGLYGSLKQFNTLDCNAFKPDARYYTGGIHFMAKKRLIWRKNKMIRLFRDRAQSLSPGEYGYILNTEELATVYHFPTIATKAPLIKRTDAKKAEPPLTLPIEGDFELRPIAKGTSSEENEPAPDNLPT